MIRKTRSLILVAVTTAAVVALALWFAKLRNERSGEQPAPVASVPDTPAPLPPGVPAAPVAPPAPIDEAQLAAGRAAYERLRCASCHSIGGRGNTNLPLDGVASRRDRQGLRDWTVGGGSARGALAGGIARMKSNYANDSDLPSLLDYLSTLR